MTAKTRKKPMLIMPPLTCQVPECPAEYPVIGDYADTDRAALLGGWIYRAGQWLCDSHRDHIPWWPGRPLALPARQPGATTAQFIGVVRDEDDVIPYRVALPAPEPLPEDPELGGFRYHAAADWISDTAAELENRCSDPPEVSCSDAGCPVHGGLAGPAVPFADPRYAELAPERLHPEDGEVPGA